MDISIVFLALALVVAAIIVRGRPHAPSHDASLGARVDQATSAVASLVGAFQERRATEARTADAISRMERLVAGSYSRGRVGENLLEAALSELPPELFVRDLVIGGRVCEFALRCDDGKYLPIDSKWSAPELVSQLEDTADMNDREQIRRKVEKVLSSRIKEVAGYIDTSLTLPMAIVAVPDQVFACCRKAHEVARASRVTIVSYSNAVSLLLSIWNLHRAYARETDEEQLAEALHSLSVCLTQLAGKIEGHLTNGLKQATNAADEMRILVSRARATVEGARTATQELPDVDIRAEAV